MYVKVEETGNVALSSTVQRLHRIFLEDSLFLLCAAGSLQEHVCRVYPAFSSPFCSVFAEHSAKNHRERNPVLFEDFHRIRDCLSAALRECDAAFAFCGSDLDGRTICVESDLDWDLYQFFCHFIRTREESIFWRKKISFRNLFSIAKKLSFRPEARF